MNSKGFTVIHMTSDINEAVELMNQLKKDGFDAVVEDSEFDGMLEVRVYGDS